MKHDYSRIKYNPFATKGTYVGEFYPALSRRAFFTSVPVAIFRKNEEKEIPSKKDLSLLLSFIILFCDPNSPFYEEKEFSERRILCMQATKIPKDGMLGRMIQDEHWWYAGMLSVYLRFTNANFDTWLSLKTSAEQVRVLLRKPIELGGQKSEADQVESRAKMAKDLIKMDADLIRVETALFRDNSSRDIVNESVTVDLGQAGYAEMNAMEYQG